MKNISEFWSLPKYIAERDDLGMPDKLVYAVLWTRRNGENVAWPSHASIAQNLGMTKRTVIRSIDNLVKKGLVEVKRGGGSATNEYSLTEGVVTKSHHPSVVTISHPTSDRKSLGPVTESHTNRTVEKNIEKNSQLTPSQEMQEFVNSIDDTGQGNDVIDRVEQWLTTKGFSEWSSRQEIRKFHAYWTELNKSGTKQRWQLERTFELKRRLNTWMTNAQKFSRGESAPVMSRPTPPVPETKPRDQKKINENLSKLRQQRGELVTKISMP